MVATNVHGHGMAPSDVAATTTTTTSVATATPHQLSAPDTKPVSAYESLEQQRCHYALMMGLYQRNLFEQLVVPTAAVAAGAAAAVMRSEIMTSTSGARQLRLVAAARAHAAQALSKFGPKNKRNRRRKRKRRRRKRAGDAIANGNDVAESAPASEQQ